MTLECHSEAFPKSINFWINNKGAMLVSSIIIIIIHIIKNNKGTILVSSIRHGDKDNDYGDGDDMILMIYIIISLVFDFVQAPSMRL